jgi:cytoskeletal protein RodZ
MSFGEYLRSAREERRVTLDELAIRTKVKHHLLADLEEDDLRRWPKYLVYRHGYVRSIADALGLDRDDVHDRFDDTFPEYCPVAFDSGRRSRKGQLARFLSLAPLALAVGLGLIAGLALSVASRRTAASVAEVEPTLDDGRRNVLLEAEVIEAAPAIAPASDDDAFQAASNAEPGGIEGEV